MHSSWKGFLFGCPHAYKTYCSLSLNSASKEWLCQSAWWRWEPLSSPSNFMRNQGMPNITPPKDRSVAMGSDYCWGIGLQAKCCPSKGVTRRRQTQRFHSEYESEPIPFTFNAQKTLNLWEGTLFIQKSTGDLKRVTLFAMTARDNFQGCSTWADCANLNF